MSRQVELRLLTGILLLRPSDSRPLAHDLLFYVV